MNDATTSADSRHTQILKSLRTLTTEVSALKRAGLEIDDGQFLAVLDLIEGGLNQVLSKMEQEER